MFGARDQPEKKKDRGDSAEDRPGGRAPAPQKSGAPSGRGDRGQRRRSRLRLGQIRVDLLDRIESEVKTVGADETPDEDGSGRPGAVTFFERREEAHRDFCSRGDFLQRDFAQHSLAAKVVSEAWTCYSRMLHPSKKPVSLFSGVGFGSARC